MLRIDVPDAWWREHGSWLLAAHERWRARPEKARPLRVRCWLGSPLAGDSGYTPCTALEGALQCAVVALETGRTPDDVYHGIGDGYAPPTVPIVDVEVSGLPIPKSSILMAPRIAVEGTRWRRKKARAELLGVKQVLIAGGPYKSLNIPLWTCVTPFVDCYMVADEERLRALLPHVSGLGRDAARGLGRVLGFEIERIDEDRSWLVGSTLMRPMPLEWEGLGHCDPSTWERRDTGLRAPYWHHRVRREAAVPTWWRFSDAWLARSETKP